jgi:acetyl-CoA synthetase
VLGLGNAASPELAAAIKDAIATDLGKPLRPEAVEFVDQLPKTRNGKVLRRLIRAAYLNLADRGDTSALENPQALEQIAKLRARP